MEEKRDGNFRSDRNRGGSFLFVILWYNIVMQSLFVQLNTQFWKEGNMYVAYIPQLNLASCGETLEEAEKNIKDATEGFFEATDKMGTTKEVLEEAVLCL